MLAVDAKVSVHGQDAALAVSLRHSHETGVGQRHGHVAVPSQKGGNRFSLVLQIKRDLQHASIQELKNGLASAGMCSEKKTGLREHGLAGQEWRAQSFPLYSGPFVMPIGPVQKRDERPGVQQHDIAHTLIARTRASAPCWTRDRQGR